MDGTVPPHEVLHSYGRTSHGLYSTKSRGTEKATDVMGKIVAYTPSEYINAANIKRSAWQGKQLKVPKLCADTSKLEYKPCVYEDKSIKNKEGKKGFGSSRPFGRDDISSMRDTLCYRDALEKELKCAKRGLEASMKAGAEAEEAIGTMRSTGGGGGGGGLSASSSSPRSEGLASLRPKLAYQFDRLGHVDEFTTKKPTSERDYGTYKISSAVIGEGCFDTSNVQAPKNAISSGKKKGGSDHLFAASISGVRSP